MANPGGLPTTRSSDTVRPTGSARRTGYLIPTGRDRRGEQLRVSREWQFMRLRQRRCS